MTAIWDILIVIGIGVLGTSAIIGGLNFLETGSPFNFSHSNLVNHLCGLTVTKAGVPIPNLAVHQPGIESASATNLNGFVQFQGCFDHETVTFTYSNTEYAANLKLDGNVTITL